MSKSITLLIFIVIGLCSFNIQSSQGQIYRASESDSELVVSSILVEPYLRIRKEIKKEITDHTQLYTTDYEGYAWDLALWLSRRLGYQKFRIITTEQYGMRENSTGSWDGIVGAVERGIAHVGISALTITKARAEAVDFSTPFLQTQLGILMLKDDAKSDDDDGKGNDGDHAEEHDGQFLFLDPFSVWLWILVLGTAIVLLFLIFFVEKFVSLKLQGDDRSKKEKLCHHFCSRVFGTPRSIATRILQVSFWIWIILIFSAYTANFAANRIIDLIQDHGDSDDDKAEIKSVQDLFKDEKMEYGILGRGSTHNYFRTSKNPLYQKMLEKMTTDDNLVSTSLEGMEMVAHGNGTFAFIGEALTMKYATLGQPCNLVLAPNYFGHAVAYGVVTRRDSTLSNPVNFAILQLKEEGILEDLEKEWFTDRSQCPEEDDDDDDGDKWNDLKLKEHEPLDLVSMAGTFYFLLAAIVIFLIIAAVELHLIAKFKAVRT